MKIECFLFSEFKENGEPRLPDTYPLDAENFMQECVDNAAIYIEEWHDERVNETSFVVVRPHDDDAKQLLGWTRDDALGLHVIVRVEPEVKFIGRVVSLDVAVTELNP